MTRHPSFSRNFGPPYGALLPWAEMLLRAVVGLTLVPHGLRSAFGMFPSSGGQSHNLTEFVDELDRGGYRPAKFWAPAIVLTQLVAGPMLALGLFTRLAALPIVIFLIVTNYERWRVGGFFGTKWVSNSR
jgi:putative oxidoreductase